MITTLVRVVTYASYNETSAPSGKKKKKHKKRLHGFISGLTIKNQERNQRHNLTRKQHNRLRNQQDPMPLLPPLPATLMGYSTGNELSNSCSWNSSQVWNCSLWHCKWISQLNNRCCWIFHGIYNNKHRKNF